MPPQAPDADMGYQEDYSPVRSDFAVGVANRGADKNSRGQMSQNQHKDSEPEPLGKAKEPKNGTARKSFPVLPKPAGKAKSTGFHVAHTATSSLPAKSSAAVAKKHAALPVDNSGESSSGGESSADEGSSDEGSSDEGSSDEELPSLDALISACASKIAPKKRGRPAKPAKAKQDQREVVQPRKKLRSRPGPEGVDSEVAQQSALPVAADTGRPSRAAAESAKENITTQCTTKQFYSTIPAPARKKQATKSRKKTVYEVERVVDHKKQAGKTMYHVKWLNYGEAENTWEPEEHLKGCQGLIDDYKARLVRAQKAKSKAKTNRIPAGKAGAKKA